MKKLVTTVALAAGALAAVVTGKGRNAFAATPTLAVEVVSDSARIIARWTKACDSKGCADSYRVQWAVNGVTVTRATTALADTFFMALPPVGTAQPVTVTVAAVRRDLVGPARSATIPVQNVDAPPPPVDSLRIDTLAYEAAQRDTFPTEVLRDSLGQQVAALDLRLGEAHTLCKLARSRYDATDVRIIVPEDATTAEEEFIVTMCATARRVYAGERSG